MLKRIQVIDSHTGGEPTRIVISGGPDLGPGTLAEQRQVFRDRFDEFRSAVVNEPRGSDVIVGALLCEPSAADCVAGVIFFNNVGVLQMCGHGAIGLAVTLGHLGRIGQGRHRLDTPVGVVTFDYDGANMAAIENVSSYRYLSGIAIDVPGIGRVTGDVAWGGNWFFLVEDSKRQLDVEHVDELTDLTWRIRKTLQRERITGADGAEIDHVELMGPPHDPRNHGRNFVLCPGKAYDRSPCGTGTSAKLACLAANGHLDEGQIWRQESVIGSVFEGSYRKSADGIIPRIEGTAYITAESTLLFDPHDPFRMGIRR